MENWREKKILQMEEQSTPVGTTERERNRYREEQSTPVGTREGEMWVLGKRRGMSRDEQSTPVDTREGEWDK